MKKLILKIEYAGIRYECPRRNSNPGQEIRNLTGYPDYPTRAFSNKPEPDFSKWFQTSGWDRYLVM